LWSLVFGKGIKLEFLGMGDLFENVHDQNASKLLSQLGSGFWGHGLCLNTVQSATIPLSFADFWWAASISLALNYPLSELEIDF